MENLTESWTLTQVGVVVKDVEKAIERLTEIGIGPFEPMTLPPDREEYFRDKRMYADFNIHGTRICSEGRLFLHTRLSALWARMKE